MHGHTVKLVLPGFGPVSHLFEVDLEGEFETLIGLWGRVRIISITRRGCRRCEP